MCNNRENFDNTQHYVCQIGSTGNRLRLARQVRAKLKKVNSISVNENIFLQYELH